MPLHTDIIHHALLEEAKANHSQKASNRILLNFAQLTVSSLDHTIATETEKLHVFIKCRDCKMLLRSFTRRIKMLEESVFCSTNYCIVANARGSSPRMTKRSTKIRDMKSATCTPRLHSSVRTRPATKAPGKAMFVVRVLGALGVWVFRRRIYE
jgi:hypothetical protein